MEPNSPESSKNPEALAGTPVRKSFVERDDWLAAAITFALSFSVYLFTLSPSIDLGYTGTLVTGARYLGVPDVPGYPLWVIYACLFSVLVPVSNIAWRMNLASAVAASMVCGIIALLTSRYAGSLLRNDEQSLDASKRKTIKLVCGVVAGLAMAFDAPFWRQAVSAGTWTFSILLLVISLALFLRWQETPERTRFFHAAVFMYAISLTNSQSFAPAAAGFELLILFTDPKLARDIFAVTAILLGAVLWDNQYPFLPMSPGELIQVESVKMVYEVVCVCLVFLSVILLVKTRAFLTRWRTVLAGLVVFGLGLTPYLLLPIFSMANPPMNWGYSRTREGFFHLVRRDQFERVHPADSISRFIEGMDGYFRVSISKFGIFYLLAALVPFCLIFQLQRKQRQWLLGMFCVFLSLSAFMVLLLDPGNDRASLDMHATYYTASHMILAILAGCGMAMIAARVGNFNQPRLGPL